MFTVHSGMFTAHSQMSTNGSHLVTAGSQMFTAYSEKFTAHSEMFTEGNNLLTEGRSNFQLRPLIILSQVEPAPTYSEMLAEGRQPPLRLPKIIGQVQDLPLPCFLYEAKKSRRVWTKENNHTSIF